MAEGRIPQSFIDEVLLRTDIVDLVDTRVKLKRAGKNYSACCPFHQEKSPSFTVNRDKQFYYCFGCGASGNAISFLMEHDHLEFIDSLKQLAGAAGLTLPETREAGGSPRESHLPLFDALESAATWFEQQLRQSTAKARAVDYLKRRGVTGQVAKAFRLGYAPPGWDNLLRQLAPPPALQQQLQTVGLLIRNEQRQSTYDAMRDRVIFPIRDFRGRVIAFGGRVLNDDKPKYLNSPESPVFHKSQELYGLYEARQSGKLSRLLVVEGYMDVVALAQFGIPEAVATLGTATSTTHVERLFRVVSDVVFCFDGDAAGRRAAGRALESALPALRDGVSVSFLFLPDGEDPDSLVRREGPELFRARITADAVPLADQLFRDLGEGKDLGTLEGRSRLASEAIPLLFQVPESLYRTLLIQRLSEITALSVEVIERQHAQVSQKSVVPASVSPVSEPYHSDASDSFPHGFIPQDLAPSEPPPWEPQGDMPSVRQRWRSHREQRSALGQRRPASPPALRSLSARLIRVLLQEPALAAEVPLTLLDTLDDTESALLRELAADLQGQQDASIAALLGRWHGTDAGSALAALAAEDSLPYPGKPAQTLQALLSRLHERVLERTVTDLTLHLQQQPNRDTLQALIQAKQALARLVRERPSIAGEC